MFNMLDLAALCPSKEKRCKEFGHLPPEAFQEAGGGGGEASMQ